MPMWRCPHCGTPQPEAARCWVCHRSSTTCSTCRHFRQSLAASVGYCGLDRRRVPLTGTEHRGCWDGRSRDAGLAPRDRTPDEAGAPGDERSPTAGSPADRLRPARGSRPGVLEGFVPVELAGRGPRTLRPTDQPSTPAPPPIVDTADRWRDGATLFGELE